MTKAMIEAVRVAARTVRCPVCQAPVGEPCYGPNPTRPRLTHHTARNDLVMGRKLRIPRHPDP